MSHAHAATREQLEAAREHALAGEYATSAVYYEGVAAAITKCALAAAAGRSAVGSGAARVAARAAALTRAVATQTRAWFDGAGRQEALAAAARRRG